MKLQVANFRVVLQGTAKNCYRGSTICTLSYADLIETATSLKLVLLLVYSVKSAHCAPATAALCNA